MVATKRDRRHIQELKLPSGDTLLRVLTQRQQMDELLRELLESEDDDGDETQDDLPPEDA